MRWVGAEAIWQDALVAIIYGQYMRPAGGECANFRALYYSGDRKLGEPFLSRVLKPLKFIASKMHQD